MKLLISLLFIVILCSSICFLINNVCNLKCDDKSSRIGIVQNENKNDSITQVIFNPKIDSLIIKTNISINKINDTIFSINIKSGANNTNNITSEIKKADSNQENLIKIVTILLSIFTAIFGIFTFLTQNSLNRAEKIKDDIDEQRQHISDERDKFQTEIEKHLNSINKIENSIQEKADKNQENSEKLLNNASELLNRNIEENKRYRDLWFLVANQFLPKDKQPSIANIRDVIELWDNERAKFAAYNLAARGDKKCLVFLNDRLKFYSSSSENENQSIASYIKTAIDEIEKREKKI